MKSHSVEIAGMKLTIRSTASEAHMRRLVDLVNGNVNAVRARSPSVPISTALALAAIRLADDLCELEDFVVRERREVAAEVRRLAEALQEKIAAIDRCVGTETKRADE